MDYTGQPSTVLYWLRLKILVLASSACWVSLPLNPTYACTYSARNEDSEP